MSTESISTGWGVLAVVVEQGTDGLWYAVLMEDGHLGSQVSATAATQEAALEALRSACDVASGQESSQDCA